MINNLINQIKTLSNNDLSILKELINKIEFDNDVNNNSINIEQFNNNVINCKYCNSIKIHKHDKRNNKQRYKCYDCEKTFSFTTNNVLKNIHSSHYLKFNQFIECFINNLSLNRTSQICKISVKTAFNWRHKIISFLTNHFKNDKLNGLIETDEIYFKDSLKGNHKTPINRTPKKHGYNNNIKNKRGLSKDKVCITTSIDRNNNIVIDKLGYGKPDSNSLINVYQDKIINPINCKLITDGEKSYKNFASFIGVPIKTLIKYKNSRLPKIEYDKENNIKYHIQNVNNFHSQIKDVVNNKFKGVSSKYLVDYINWVKWNRLHKDDFYVMVKKLKEDLFK